MTWFAIYALFGAPLVLAALGWAVVLLDERSDRRAAAGQYTLPGIKEARHERTAGKGLGLAAGVLAILTRLLDALGVHNNRA